MNGYYDDGPEYDTDIEITWQGVLCVIGVLGAFWLGIVGMIVAFGR